jgi:DNA-binding MarR family transcriptional regulator
LRWAWNTYKRQVGGALAEAGFDDVPRNGAYVIRGIAGGQVPLSELIEELRVSKQSAGQLVDTLVTRGYLSRSEDPADRRRLTVALTERGLAAASVVKAVVDGIEAELVKRVGIERVTDFRWTLITLAQIQLHEEHGGDAASFSKDPR